MDVFSLTVGLLIGLMFGFFVLLVIADRIDSFQNRLLNNVIKALEENKYGRTAKKNIEYTK